MVRRCAVTAGRIYKSSRIAKLIELDKENMYFETIAESFGSAGRFGWQRLCRIARSTTEEGEVASPLFGCWVVVKVKTESTILLTER